MSKQDYFTKCDCCSKKFYVLREDSFKGVLGKDGILTTSWSSEGDITIVECDKCGEEYKLSTFEDIR